MAAKKPGSPTSKAAGGGKAKVTVRVKANLQGLGADDERPSVHAYLFSASGDLIDSKPLDAKGAASFATNAGSGEQRKYRVAVGPETPQIRRLSSFGAQFAERRAALGDTVNLDFDILAEHWRCWYGVLYFVRGTVRKKITIGDQTILRPVCNADVEIYEVDLRLCLLTLPERLLERLRDGLIREFDPPGPDPVIRRRLPELERAPQPPGPRPAHSAAAAADPAATAGALLRRSTAPAALSPTVLRSAQPQQLRRLLVDNLTLIKPLLCFYLGPPFCYRTDLLRTVQTDSMGRFSTIIGFLCPTEEPDLYFKVKQEINGVDKTIYAPTPIPCHTYWNYASGTEVDILVTDPEAISCQGDPVPDASGCYVMPLGIGFDGWHQVLNAHGKTPAVADRGLYNGDDPYGTSLDFTMKMHDSLQAKGIRYYRWSYRREGIVAWTHIASPIIHRYLDEGPPAKIRTFDLGPTAAGAEVNLFRLRNPNLDWLEIRASDRTFAQWDTAGFQDGVWTPLVADGNYELRLQMFDAGGNVVSPGAATWRYFLPIGPEVAGEIPVDDSLALAHADGSLRLRLHINNQDTVADVKSIALSGEAVTDCQFLEYANPAQLVTITFDANHPHSAPQDFLASWALGVRRGASGTPVGATSGTGSVTNATFDISAGDLLRQVTYQGVSRGPFDRCAFAVNLHTNPRTRDGYGRIRRYEAHDVAAFAVVPAGAVGRFRASIFGPASRGAGPFFFALRWPPARARGDRGPT